MVSRDHGERWDQENISLVVGLVANQSLEIQYHRKQRDTIEGNAMVGKISRDSRGPRRAIALTEQVERRTPAFISRDVETNEFAECFDVTLHSPEFLEQLGIARATEPCAYRIH